MSEASTVSTTGSDTTSSFTGCVTSTDSTVRPGTSSSNGFCLPSEYCGNGSEKSCNFLNRVSSRIPVSILIVFSLLSVTIMFDIYQ